MLVNSQPLPWKCRLRIAMGIANAIAYLHTAFSRPVVHRDIKSPTIILDKENVARLIDFSLSISIPEGQLHAEDSVRGRMSLIDPEYLSTGHVNQKTDVFSFGRFLLELLGPPIGFLAIGWAESVDVQNRLIEIVDPALLKERIDAEQFLAFARLGLSCLCEKGEDRPEMIDVAKQLRRIYQSVSPL
ncbi:serine/threonine-protein kinase ZRK1-like [Corylus avellana]|uniref:serine/threonine-protein kinase ZRK1-like n=1 Tax=Corylus avellana TaxID=13451 RepID=UPI001E222487|nr:serine/threonine-protein kinase ZRK1-like [Corylus avellana]